MAQNTIFSPGRAHTFRIHAVLKDMDNTFLFTCRHLPARLTTDQTATLLGVRTHDIPVLVAAKILRPLGSPAPNAPKYFAAVAVEEMMGSPEAMEKITKVLARHWQKKNSSKMPKTAH